jgi:CheY-like chemotaxis protein
VIFGRLKCETAFLHFGQRLVAWRSLGKRMPRSGAGDFLAYKILVVDDNKDMRDLMTLLFEPEGYEVAEACDGEQALVKLNDEPLPDLIFLDHNMEIMDGPNFLKELEQNHPEILARVPIILITGLDSKSIRDTRATEVIAKPIGIEPLLSLVKRYLH